MFFFIKATEFHVLSFIAHYNEKVNCVIALFLFYSKISWTKGGAVVKLVDLLPPGEKVAGSSPGPFGLVFGEHKHSR